jgi:hypothetical protein
VGEGANHGRESQFAQLGSLLQGQGVNQWSSCVGEALQRHPHDTEKAVKWCTAKVGTVDSRKATAQGDKATRSPAAGDKRAHQPSGASPATCKGGQTLNRAASSAPSPPPQAGTKHARQPGNTPKGDRARARDSEGGGSIPKPAAKTGAVRACRSRCQSGCSHARPLESSRCGNAPV